MAKTKDQKRKAKRKQVAKQRREARMREVRKDEAEYCYDEAIWSVREESYDKALSAIDKAIKRNPNKPEYLEYLAFIGNVLHRPDVECRGLWALYTQGQLRPELRIYLADVLKVQEHYQEAAALAEESLEVLKPLQFKHKRTGMASLKRIKENCETAMEFQRLQEKSERRLPDVQAHREPEPPLPAASTNQPAPLEPPPLQLPEIPLTINIDLSAFESVFTGGFYTTPQHCELVLEAHRLQFKESFENLICLHSLNGVTSLWYQEETVRKVLRAFHGRALLSDEVGLGKTIEALLVLKEYVERGMVKSALILTPTPLVSQWRDELREKFGLFFDSTDDEKYRAGEDGFWRKPFILASINIAKSKKNFDAVTTREYDLVIVDEAHHLKNKSTLNWRLVNTLKKRFLLLLTATPVENNLMELYNLITLLKPGQLKTASAFRQEFMTRADPTDPQNRTRLKELLGQVMIRNTRAVANINIPPRFAQTIIVDSDANEQSLYERVTGLVQSINRTNGTGHRLMLKTLLAEAGSSPRAVSRTLTRITANSDLLHSQRQEMEEINNLCRSLDRTTKNKFLLKVLRSSSEKTIIFVKYLATLEHVCEFLSWEGIRHAVFHGGLDNQKKDDQIRSFQRDTNVLVATEIGGEGHNLQFCHQMINYDLPWNPMKIEQRIGRLHRLGQTQEVMMYNLCARGSVEEYILDILDKKINMFELVIGEIDMILGRTMGEMEFTDAVYDIWVNATTQEERTRSFTRLGSQLKRAKNQYRKTKELDEKLFGENYEM